MHIFHTGPSNINCSSSTHVLENTYTIKKELLSAKIELIFFKSNLKNIWEWSEETKETAELALKRYINSEVNIMYFHT